MEVTVRAKRVLIGGFNRPPNSGSDYFHLISESIDRAHNTNINDIIIVGDFNYKLLSNENNRVKDLMQLYGLKQLIKEATHYTEHSVSLIDLIMVRNESNILISGVADPFISDQIRYHCPTVVLLKFTRPTLSSYKRKIWNYARADFDKFREILREHDLATQIQHTDINTGVQQITEAVFDAASKSIPNKTVTIRPNDHPWITCHIKNLIRKRKRCHKIFKKNREHTLLGQIQNLKKYNNQ